MVYGDGSALFTIHPSWVRASFAIVYGIDSNLNISGPLPGTIQSIFRAELAWLTVAAFRAWRPTCLNIDNESVSEIANIILKSPDVD
eukprot:3260395-Karenia_brevis.AAC.1